MIYHIALTLQVMRDVTYITVILISTVNDYVIAPRELRSPSSLTRKFAESQGKLLVSGVKLKYHFFSLRELLTADR